MASKKQYYKLDEIGFVGVQSKGSDASSIRKDIERTIQFVNKRKAEQKVLSDSEQKTVRVKLR